MMNVNDRDKLFKVTRLKTSFFTPRGEIKAVDDISYSVSEQEIVAIVGESGCGKSVSQLSVLQLIQSPPGKILGGEVLLRGQNILEYPPQSPEMRKIRGARIAMIFQEPMTSLNPVFTVGTQLTEVIRNHRKCSKREAWRIGAQALETVGIPDPLKRMKNYPFEMSGGMRQRVMIATAVACRSELIIADEPTTALDVTTQAQVMELLLSLVEELRTSLLIITHNLGLVTRYAQRIYVMYAGKIVESGTTEEVLTNPHHPYTIGLLRSIPQLDGDQNESLVPIKGYPPSLIDMPNKCAFLPRCAYACNRCKTSPTPSLQAVGGAQHKAACYLDLGGAWRAETRTL